MSSTHRPRLSRLILGAVVVYVGASVLVHRVIWPEQVPDDAYPIAGDVVDNPLSGERLRFEVGRADSGGAYTQMRLALAPGGSVPFAHIHGDVEETFEVLEGEVTMEVGGDPHQARPGHTVVVPAGAAHRPRNLSDADAVVRVTVRPPGQMDLCLVQLHGYFVSEGTDASTLSHFLQMVRFADAYDIYTDEAPVWLQRVAVAMLAPTARALGYDAYAPRFSSAAGISRVAAP